VRVGPFLSHQAVMPPQDGTRRDQPVCPQRSGQLPDQRGQHRPVGRVHPGPGLVRRSTAISCSSTSSSAFLDADERPSVKGQLPSRMRIR
jgi:hypothetical protein